MQVIVTYSECAFLFNEIGNDSPDNNRSDEVFRRKRAVPIGPP